MEIKSAVALVTGANRGLWHALVWELLEAGASKVYSATRTGTPVHDSRVVPLALDITNAEQIASAAAKAHDVTLLINHAGVLNSLNVLTATHAELNDDFRTNVFGALAAIRPFIPVLELAADPTLNRMRISTQLLRGGHHSTPRCSSSSAESSVSRGRRIRDTDTLPSRHCHFGRLSRCPSLKGWDTNEYSHSNLGSRFHCCWRRDRLGDARSGTTPAQ